MDTTLQIVVDGLGLMIYSPWALAHVADDEDYFSSYFERDEDVAEHVRACSVATFCTGSPGTYVVRCTTDLPKVNAPAFDNSIRLGLEVRDETACIRDVYDLMEWSADCPADQQLRLRDGYYRLTVSSRRPESGITGDIQEVLVLFEPWDKRPGLAWDGVPSLLV